MKNPRNTIAPKPFLAQVAAKIRRRPYALGAAPVDGFGNNTKRFRKTGKRAFETMIPAADLLHAEGLLSLARSNLSILEKSHLIDATQWANEFSFGQIKNLARFMEAYTVDEDTVLFCENERTAYLVLIVKGRVDVVKFDSSGKSKKIATLGSGKTIGEMSLIDGEPRSASAITGTPSTLLVMTADGFSRLNSAFPGIGIALVLKIAKQMSQYLRQTSGRLIDHLGD